MQRNNESLPQLKSNEPFTHEIAKPKSTRNLPGFRSASQAQKQLAQKPFSGLGKSRNLVLAPINTIE